MLFYVVPLPEITHGNQQTPHPPDRHERPDAWPRV